MSDTYIKRRFNRAHDLPIHGKVKSLEEMRDELAEYEMKQKSVKDLFDIAYGVIYQKNADHSVTRSFFRVHGEMLMRVTIKDLHLNLLEEIIVHEHHVKE